MENKNEKFLKIYFEERDRKKQLNLLKNYMLSLSAEDLKEFMLEPLNFLEKALLSSDISDDRKKKIFENLDATIYLLKGKVAA